MKPKKRNAVVKLMEFLGIKKAHKLNIFSPEIRNEVVAIHEMLSYIAFLTWVLGASATIAAVYYIIELLKEFCH